MLLYYINPTQIPGIVKQIAKKTHYFKWLNETLLDLGKRVSKDKIGEID